MPLLSIRNTAILLVAGLLVAPLAPAHAQSASFTCVGSGASVSCAGRLGPAEFPQIIQVREPYTERELAEASDRDRKWLARCEPILRQDRNGVRRYLYKAPDCDVGRYDD